MIALKAAIMDETAGALWQRTETETAVPIAAIYDQWLEYIRRGTYPDPGGWNDQKIETIAHFKALTEINIIYTTPAEKWNELSPSQIAIKAWIDQDG